MSWSQQYPGLGMTPMNRSRLGLGEMGDPTQQYANDPYPSMQSSMMPTNPFSPFSMSSMLPLNKFSGSGMGNLLGGYGMMNPWVQNPWDNYQPTQWAGPNAHYPNWNDPPGPLANDVAMMGPYPVPTDPSLPPPVEVVEVLDSSNPQSPNWEGPDPEMVQAQMDRTRRNSLNFYRNNPDHPLSRFDTAVRNLLGVQQLDSPGQLAGKPQTVPQGYTPQTQATNMGQGITPNSIAWLSQYPGQNTMQNLGVTNPSGLMTNQGVPIPNTLPHGTSGPNVHGDMLLSDANLAVTRANERRAAQAQENARIAADQARQAAVIPGLRSLATGGPGSQALGAQLQRGRNYGRWAEDQRIEREKQRNQQKAAAARRAGAKRAAAARTAKQKAGVARRSAEGAGRDTAGDRSAGMGGGRGGFAGPDRW